MSDRVRSEPLADRQISVRLRMELQVLEIGSIQNAADSERGGSIRSDQEDANCVNCLEGQAACSF